jgi:hypothetical protein
MLFINSAFLKDFSVVGKNCRKAHFPCPPLRIVIAEYHRHELPRGICMGGMPQEIFKIWVSEIAFPAF